MNGEALGLIETVGMAAAIEAADTCVKSANVKLIGYELSRGFGMVTVKINGDVGAVKAAIEAAKASASKVNKVYATLIIPRPAKDIDSIVESKLTVGVKHDSKEEVQKPAENVESNEAADVESTNQEVLYDDLKNGVEVGSAEIQITEPSKEEKVILSIDKKMPEANKTPEDNKTNNHENNEDVCNICHDPTCPRRKGQPRNLCKHYKKS